MPLLRFGANFEALLIDILRLKGNFGQTYYIIILCKIENNF